MPVFDLADLRERGFKGFVTIEELDDDPPEVPSESGVYVVVRERTGPPRFLDRSGGGWWKGKDPTVPTERLEREWVDGAQTLYIGKAASLRQRIGLLLGFSRGRPIMHWGGRLLWQVETCETLLVAWLLEPNFAELESKLIDDFVAAYGRLPFANLKRGDRVLS